MPATRLTGTPLFHRLAAACARETATLIRLSENRKARSRGISSPLEVVIDTRQIGASCPWNLSTVPTGTPGGRAAFSALTCAL